MRTHMPSRLLVLTAVGVGLVGAGAAGSLQAADPFVAGQTSTRAVALGSALELRREGQPRSKRHLVGLIVGAVLVAGIVTPALAATEAGQHAVPHGEHLEMVEPGHH